MTDQSNETELHQSSYEKKKHKLNMVNLVISDQKIQLLPEFTIVVKEYFRGDVQTADFVNNAVEETNKVNEWVSNQTNHKIKKIFEKLESDTTIVIVNVLYFKGESIYKKGINK